jgi:membrane-associated phospholipid phosphatase
MKTFINKNKFFLLLCTFWVLALAPVIIFIPKGTTHLFINSYHSTITDLFFKYFTNLGDGVVPFILAIIFLFFSYRKSILVVASGLAAGIFVQILKRFFFEDVNRPVKFFGPSELHLVDGVKMNFEHSFPSGHSATIFALCFCLASLTSSKLKKIVLFCTAVLISFSRVYLSQHFIIDIYAGSIIGILSAIIVIVFLNRQNNNWLDSSLIKTLK